ncbi:MAG: YceH family protein [Geobacteraceae bacterium]|nr:YceH family protein [Geobacteraceae bacterium]
MTMPINDVETRILGALIEKELTTPEYYPLTLNSLTNACNQKSNRDPVVAFDEEDVVRGLDKMRVKGYARLSGEGGRVPKYCHCLGEKLAPPELAVLAELLLRGPQTLGELRTRCERMSPFADIAAVEEVLADLQKFELMFVTLLPRQPGQKEQRYAHLLSGEPVFQSVEKELSPEKARVRVMAEDERFAALEAEVHELKDEVASLKKIIDEFRAQFE